MAEVLQPQHKVDVRYINPFIEACRTVFEKMIHVDAKIGKLSIRSPQTFFGMTERFGVAINVEGNMKGTVALHFSLPVALKLATVLTGEDVCRMNESATDALSEITNMILGNAKRQFTDKQVKIGLPRPIGTNQVSHRADVKVLIVPLMLAFGKILLEIGVVCEEAVTTTADQTIQQSEVDSLVNSMFGN